MNFETKFRKKEVELRKRGVTHETAINELARIMQDADEINRYLRQQSQNSLDLTMSYKLRLLKEKRFTKFYREVSIMFGIISVIACIF